jgi:hypothetical protein
VLDRVVSSYTPTARALAHARQARRGRGLVASKPSMWAAHIHNGA